MIFQQYQVNKNILFLDKEDILLKLPQSKGKELVFIKEFDITVLFYDILYYYTIIVKSIGNVITILI